MTNASDEEIDRVLPGWFLATLRTLPHDAAVRGGLAFVHVVGSGRVYATRCHDHVRHPAHVEVWLVGDDDAASPATAVHVVRPPSLRANGSYFFRTQMAAAFTALCRGDTFHHAGDLCAIVKQEARCDAAAGTVTLKRTGELVQGTRLVGEFGHGEPWWEPTGPQLVTEVLAGKTPPEALIDFVLENQ